MSDFYVSLSKGDRHNIQDYLVRLAVPSEETMTEIREGLAIGSSLQGKVSREERSFSSTAYSLKRDAGMLSTDRYGEFVNVSPTLWVKATDYKLFSQEDNQVSESIETRSPIRVRKVRRFKRGIKRTRPSSRPSTRSKDVTRKMGLTARQTPTRLRTRKYAELVSTKRTQGSARVVNNNGMMMDNLGTPNWEIIEAKPVVIRETDPDNLYAINSRGVTVPGSSRGRGNKGKKNGSRR